MTKTKSRENDAVSVKRSAYVPHKRVSIEFGKVSRTREEFAADCDINQIMARYAKTGQISNLQRGEPRYLDLSDAPDFHKAMNLLNEADAAFMRLPAATRRDFGNDAARFVEFAENPENIDKMREWGLAPPAEAPAPPTRVEVVNPPPAPADE